jgi:hypothetical protein
MRLPSDVIYDTLNRMFSLNIFLIVFFFCAKFKKNLDSSHYFLTQSSKKKYKLVIKNLLQEYFWQK